MATQTFLTVEQFLESPEFANEDRRRLELRKGEIVDMGETSGWHNSVRDEIQFAIKSFLKRTKLGQVLVETGIRIDSNSWYRAEVVFWDTAHWASIDLDRGVIEVIPQLVVEVVSPSERAPFEKADDYIRAGVQTVWVVFRRPYETHVFESNGGRGIVRAGGRLEARELLPGFSEDPASFLPE